MVIWIFPKGNGTANIGLGVSENRKTKSASSYLNDFLIKNFRAFKLMSLQACVPCFNCTSKILRMDYAYGRCCQTGKSALPAEEFFSMVGGSFAAGLQAESILIINPN